MKLYDDEIENNLVGLNCANLTLKSVIGQDSEASSSGESLLTLLNAGIARQSQGDSSINVIKKSRLLNKSEMFPKIKSFDVATPPNRSKERYVAQDDAIDMSVDDLIKQQPAVVSSDVLEEKTKSRKRLPEEREMGNEPIRKRKKKKYTDFDRKEIVPEESSQIGSEANDKKKRKKHTDKDIGEKRKHNISITSSVVNDEQPALGDNASKEKKRKHKNFPEEETRYDTDGSVKKKKKKKHLQDAPISPLLLQGSEKHKKAKKPSLDSSFPTDNIEKRKHNISKTSSALDDELRVLGDDGLKKKEKKHNKFAEEETTCDTDGSVKKKKKKKHLQDAPISPLLLQGSEKHKKAKKPSLDSSFPTDTIEKRKHNISKTSSALDDELRVLGDDGLKKKKKKHKKFAEEETTCATDESVKKKKKKKHLQDAAISPLLLQDNEKNKKTKKPRLDNSSPTEYRSMEIKSLKLPNNSIHSSTPLITDTHKKHHIEKDIGEDLNGELCALGDDTSKEKKKKKHKKCPEEETRSDTDGSVKRKKKKKRLQDAAISPLLLQGSEDRKKAKKSRLDGSFSTEHRLMEIESPKLHSSSPLIMGTHKKYRSLTPPKDSLAETDKDLGSKKKAKHLEKNILEQSGTAVEETDSNHKRKKRKENKKADVNGKTSYSESEESLATKAKVNKSLEGGKEANVSDSECSSLDDTQYKPQMKKQFDVEDSKILKNINILIPFEVPQTHLIETRISNKPPKKQREQFQTLNVTMKTRPYTNAEDTAIKANWEEFCRTHDIPKKPELFMNLAMRGGLRPPDRLSFVRFLGRGLENRMLYSIYTRFKLLFGTHKKGKFTPEEDKTIREFMEKPNGTRNKYAVLATMLDRSKDSIKAHYRILNSGKVTWSLKRMKELIENLMKVLGTDVIDELKTVPIETSHWKEVENIMGISGTKLRGKWLEYIYPRLFAGNYNNLPEVRKKLINLLYDNSEYDRKEINWNELALDFDGMSGRRLFKVFVDLADMYVPKELKTSFKDTVDFLKNEYLVRLQSDVPVNTVRLEYQKGELREIRS